VLPDPRGDPRARPVTANDRSFCSVQRLGRRFEVDPCAIVEHELNLASALERVVTEGASELGEQRAQRRVGALGEAVMPERVEQRGARRGPKPVEGQEHEQEASLPAR
jgi:hypothetical protein